MPWAGSHPVDPAAPIPETVRLGRVDLRAQASGCLGIRVMRARLRPLLGGFCRGHAENVGYTSEAAFSRAFKRRYGTPPARWRRDMRAKRS
jgi:hypothetical protein